MRLTFTIAFILFSLSLAAQTTKDHAVRITATTSSNPARVQLSWEATTSTGQVSVYRKQKDAASWGNPIATLSATTTTYTDNNVSKGAAYEYLVYKADSNGWEVIRKDFARSATVGTVKSYITATAQANSSVSAVYILGHIAVPYSGEIVPDGHTNNHVGAWPADVYYGDINGTWTDNSVNNTTSGNSRNHNIPGDGKFDQSNLPGDVELQVGRVDVSEMPAFGKTEIQLMKSYLAKAHSYKTGSLAVIKRGLIDDNFNSKSYFPEAFAANGWRNFAVLVGKDSIKTVDLIATLNNNFYQWVFGCGGGTYTSAGGIGNTNNIASNNMKSIFTILFGSYFGDWNYQNNFLRAPLCAPEPALATCWAGRPNWFFHHMALGEHIGYSARLTQNNTTLYATAIPQLGKMIHIALMGDPSLRTEYVKPVQSVNLTSDPAAGAKLSWTASTEPGIAGYYIYRSKTEYGEYKLRSDMVTGTSFTDSFGTNGTYWYMVRAAKLQQTPSGTYYNMSIGDVTSGNVVYPYFEVGVDEVVSNKEAVTIYPNPASEQLFVQFTASRASQATLDITDLHGRTMFTVHTTAIKGNNTQAINIAAIPSGVYLLHINADGMEKTVKFSKVQ